MRLVIPCESTFAYYGLQTTIVDVRYACRDERCCLRPTNGQGRREMYCPQCPHTYREGACLFATPDHMAERAIERQMMGYRNVVQSADPDAKARRKHGNDFSLGKVCAYPGCDKPVSNKSTHCLQHAAVMSHQRRREVVNG